MVSRGYFTLGSRFSRLPVNFFPVICLRLGGRRNGREEWGKKKKRTYGHGRIAIVAERQPGTRFLTTQLTKTRSYVN